MGSLSDELRRSLPPGFAAEAVSASIPLSGGRLLLAPVDGAVRVLQRGSDHAAFCEVALSGRPILEGDALILSCSGDAPRHVALDWLESDVVADLLRQAASPQLALAQAAHLELLRTLLQPTRQLVLILLDRLRVSQPPSATMPLDIPRIQRELSSATTAEILQLVNLLRTEWAIPEAAASTPAASGRFSVAIADAGPNHIAVIKAVRELTRLGLREAKELVDQCGVALTAVPSDEAARAKAALEQAGARVTLIPTA